MPLGRCLYLRRRDQGGKSHGWFIIKYSSFHHCHYLIKSQAVHCFSKGFINLRFIRNASKQKLWDWKQYCRFNKSMRKTFSTPQPVVLIQNIYLSRKDLNGTPEWNDLIKLCWLDTPNHKPSNCNLAQSVMQIQSM